ATRPRPNRVTLQWTKTLSASGCCYSATMSMLSRTCGLHSLTGFPSTRSTGATSVPMFLGSRKSGRTGRGHGTCSLTLGFYTSMSSRRTMPSFFDQIAEGVRELVPARSLTINWEKLAATDTDVEIEQFFADLASQAKKGKEVLVILDKASDSYPLA